MKPMNRIALAIVAAVVAAALTAAFALSMTASARTQTARVLEGYGKVSKIYVPAQKIPAGSIVQATMLRQVDWPAALLPEGAVVDSKAVVGKTAVQALYPSEPIIGERIGDKASAKGIAVPKGEFAVSVATKDTLAVGGAIEAGNRVRLVVTDSGGVTGTVADSLLVLATSNGDAGAVADGKGGFLSQAASTGGLTWVTLAVTEPMLNKVIQASDVGTLHLVLIQ